MSGLKAKGALSMYTEVKRAVCSKLAVSGSNLYTKCQPNYITIIFQYQYSIS